MMQDHLLSDILSFSEPELLISRGELLNNLAPMYESKSSSVMCWKVEVMCVERYILMNDEYLMSWWVL